MTRRDGAGAPSVPGRARRQLGLDLAGSRGRLRVAEMAAEAYVQYGKGRHPAALNMGDCFAYACAKANGARLLYRGEDFAKTDLA